MTAVLPALIAMLAVQAIVSFSSQSGPVLAPLAAPDLGVETLLVGYYVAAAYACAATAGLFSGGFIARFGALRTSQACLAVCAVAMALAASGNPYLVALSALVIGCGYGPATPASSHMLSRVTPPRYLNLVFSIKQTGVPLGNALAGAIVPSIALAFGWQAACLVVAVVALALAAAIHPFRERFDAERDKAREPFALKRTAATLVLIWNNRPIRRLALTSLAYSGMQVCVSTFLVVYLHEHIGIAIVTAEVLLAVAQAGGVSGRIVWGFVADRSGKPMAVLAGLGFAMTVCALLAASFGPNWPTVLIGAVVFVYGGTAIAWNGVYLAQIARLAPEGQAGEITGGTSFFTFGGVVIVPSIFSSLLSATGSYAFAFSVAGIATLAAGITFVAASRSPLSAPPRSA